MTTAPTPVPLAFGLAFAHLHGGDHMARRSCRAGEYIWFDRPAKVIRTADGHPWQPTQDDILADDWHVVKEAV